MSIYKCNKYPEKDFDYDFYQKKEKYHHWVYAADDQINKVLKTMIILLYSYGFYVIIRELVEKYIV